MPSIYHLSDNNCHKQSPLAPPLSILLCSFSFYIHSQLNLEMHVSVEANISWVPILIWEHLPHSLEPFSISHLNWSRHQGVSSENEKKSSLQGIFLAVIEHSCIMQWESIIYSLTDSCKSPTPSNRGIYGLHLSALSIHPTYEEFSLPHFYHCRWKKFLNKVDELVRSARVAKKPVLITRETWQLQTGQASILNRVEEDLTHALI